LFFFLLLLLLLVNEWTQRHDVYKKTRAQLSPYT